MTDGIIGYAVCISDKIPRFFIGMMQGDPVLSANAEDMHIFDRFSAAEVMRLLVEKRMDKEAQIIKVMEGVRK